MNGVTMVIQDNMKCCIYNKIRRGRVNGKERFRMSIFYGLKISQNFEMEIFKGKNGERGNISRKIILKNSRGIC